MSWQKNLAQGFASTHALLEFLNLAPNLGSHEADKSFKTRVPLGFAKRMKPMDPKDPLLLQVLAQDIELADAPSFVKDPLEEDKSNPLPGLLHKYQGRVLFLLTGACAVHCRYCFRRHFPYNDNKLKRDDWTLLWDYLEKDETIHELILSGGDPLLTNDGVLKSFFEKLVTIKHIKTLRFHTRIPIVLPERITESFCELLKNLSLRKVMVMHCNHPQEVNATVDEACKKLKNSGCNLLNQSVLLAGINNDAIILQNLSERLFDAGILPYYLHLLDKVSGAAHFDLSLHEALQIYKELQSKLPGYLLPRLVREEVGQRSKTLIYPTALEYQFS